MDTQELLLKYAEFCADAARKIDELMEEGYEDLPHSVAFRVIDLAHAVAELGEEVIGLLSVSQS